jgi:hypothetical protein
MKEITRKQAVDFQSIAVEELERGNYDTAQDFAEEVLRMLQEEEP